MNMPNHLSSLLKPIAFVALAALAGCGLSAQDVTRTENVPLTFHTQDDPALELLTQAEALRDMSADLVRRSTMQGALSGAAIGCGAAIVVGTDASTCAKAAFAAGAAGAIFGRKKGQKAVADDIAATSPEDMSRVMRGIRGQTDRVAGALPAYLAAQDAEIARLQEKRDTGEISQAQYTASLDAIRANRGAVAEAFTTSVDKMRVARSNLRDQSDRRASDLNDTIQVASEVEGELASARSSIPLF